MLKRKKITYCLPRYNAKDSKPLLPSSSVPGERTHRLLLHCPLSSGYVLGAGLSFSFLGGTEIKKAGDRRVNTSNWEFSIENRDVEFPKATIHTHFVKPAPPFVHWKTISKTPSKPKFGDR